MCSSDLLEKLKRLAALAHELDLELNQLAITYMLTLPGMGPVISSASTIKQLESNAAAGKVILTDDDRQRVKEIIEIP